MARKVTKPERLWAVFFNNGRIDVYSVRSTRRAAIAEFCHGPGVPTWGYWRKRGCYAARIAVTPEPTNAD